MNRNELLNKVNVTNRELVEQKIALAQGKATARTIDYQTVLDTLESIEARLTSILYKKDWTGIVVKVDPNAQNFPGSYKYTPESTNITFFRISNGWQVTIGRGACLARKYRIDLSAKAEALTDYIGNNF